MNRNKLTIITPTYNRAELLHVLYDSLCGQTCQDFTWLVVDDGSTDETEQIMGEYLEKHGNAKFILRYVKQENGGKHRALNRGIGMIDSELTFIVDSDDKLPRESVETILKYHEKYVKDRENYHLCGYSFLRCHDDGSVNTAYFPQDEMIGTYRDVRINGNIGGDKAEVYYTDILKKYPFPEFESEKFLAEDVVWMQMSGPYQMVHINENIYTCDYLEGGLTKSGHRMKIHSPKGMVLRSKIYLQDSDVKLKVKVKMMLLYIVYSRFAGTGFGQIYADSVKKGLCLICYLPAQIIYTKWKSE